MYAITTSNLNKFYDKLKAIDKLNLDINEGEIFGLLGPNGAGKTTLISMLCTILKPTDGKAFVLDHDVVENKDDVRKIIGIVFQESTLDDELTALENLELHGRFYGVESQLRKKRIQEVLDLVGLMDKKDIIVKTFSGGMKRRLEIARSLVHHPKVLFLDEPTLGLDPQTRRKIWEFIKQLNEKEKTTVILTTHYMDEAESLCDRIAIIDKGQIVAAGSSSELKYSIQKDLITLSCSDNQKMYSKLDKTKGVTDLEMIKDVIHLKVVDIKQAVPKLLDIAKRINVEIFDISIRKPSLEDVFIHYTGRTIRDETSDTKEMFKRASMGRFR